MPFLPPTKKSFIFIGDIHWGAMSSAILEKELELVIGFITRMTNSLDMVVIGGDYFDHRLNLNSTAAKAAIDWMDKLYYTCLGLGVKAIRIIKGTHDHDNDQLDIIRTTYDRPDSNFLKIYDTTTIEEVFPGFVCAFCPDELMTVSDYHETYIPEFLNNKVDVGFFHGNFDVVLPDIEQNRILDNNLPIMIYEYNKFSKLIKGPMLAGHWHVATAHNSNLWYSGSFSRWKYGEERDKGFIYGIYNMEDNSYYLKRIHNFAARKFVTLVPTNIGDTEMTVQTPEEFANLIGNIEHILACGYKGYIYIKVKYSLYPYEVDVTEQVNALKRRYANNQYVKVVVQDDTKKFNKYRKSRFKNKNFAEYDYLFDPNNTVNENILRFIGERAKTTNLINMDDISRYLARHIDISNQDSK